MKDPKKDSNIVFVRHGDAGRDRIELTETGRRQISYTAHEIKRIFSHEHPVVITSERRRATESAKILKKALTAHVDIFDCLSVNSNSGLLSMAQLESAVMVILEFSKHSDLVVVVTHSELMTALPMLVVNEIHDRYCAVSQSEYIGPGEGLYYDAGRKGFVHIRPRVGI